MEEKFVVVGIYQNSHTAHILRSRLESEGIEAWVTDEQSIMNTQFFSKKVGGAKLQVREQDADKALKIINTIQHSHLN